MKRLIIFLTLLFFFAPKFAEKARAQVAPIPDTIINLPCDKRPEMMKFVNLFPYPDSSTTEWYIPASGTCNGPYWIIGQFHNTLCVLDTAQSKAGYSCNPLAKFLDSLTNKLLPVDCFMQDSSDNRFVFKIDPKDNTTLTSFSVHNAYVKESMMSVPQDKPNLAKTFVIKAFEENGTFLGRWSMSLVTFATKDSAYWLNFNLNLNLQAGKKYKLNIFGMDPFYGYGDPNKPGWNPPIWEALGFKATYKCGGPQGTCNWDSIPKQIWRDPFYEFPCNASESWEWTSSCGDNKIVQYNFSDREAPVIVNCTKDVTITLPNDICETNYTVPSVMVTDNCAGPLIVVKVRTPYGDIDQNGGVIQGVRPGGPYNIIYTVEDICGNQGVPCSYYLTVKETGGFTLVCKGTTVVSLNDSCSFVPAKTFVVGTTGLCCPSYTVYGMRMDNGKVSKDLKFCCSDVGKKVMIMLTAVSDCDTTIRNSCMVEVTVQDKSVPRITCPRDITVSCDTFDLSNLSKYGKPIATGNCGVSVKDTFNVSLDDCKAGTVVRTFTATGSNGMTATCSQTITVLNTSLLTKADVIWPRDTILYGCHPDSSSTILGKPHLNYGYRGCRKALFAEESSVYTVSGYGDCKKILRIWKALDCCAKNSIFAIDTQFIQIKDTTSPVFTFFPKDTIVKNPRACDTSVLIKFDSVLVKDLCGNVKVTSNTPKGGADPTGYYKDGVHKIDFTATDECGNTAKATFTITVVDGKPPTPYCLNGLSIPLQKMPGGYIQMLNARLLDKDGKDNCTLKSKLKISFSKDPSDTVKTFDCSNVGENVVEVWYTDERGNQDFCKTKVLITDNLGLCPPTFKDTLMVAGALVRPNGKEVEHVKITLDSASMLCSGFYKFDSLAPKTHVVKPFKDDDPLEGVSTRDIVLIQRHILGLYPFTPYQMIAADVTKSGSVTTADITEIRKMILGTNSKYTNNFSWRFVPQAYQFPAGTMNWGFPESLNVGFGTPPGDVMDAHFFGIKIGDVDGSSNFSSLVTREREEGEDFLVLKVSPNPAGDYIIVDCPYFDLFEDGELSIIDIMGRGVYFSKFYSGMKIDIKDLNNGIYILKVNSEKLEDSDTKVFLKL